MTAADGEAYGTKLVAKGGEIESQDLFQHQLEQRLPLKTYFIIPARLKYMKSLQAELAHIVDVVNRLSLAHPELPLPCLMMVVS